MNQSTLIRVILFINSTIMIAGLATLSILIFRDETIDYTHVFLGVMFGLMLAYLMKSVKVPDVGQERIFKVQERHILYFAAKEVVTEERMLKFYTPEAVESFLKYGYIKDITYFENDAR